MTPADAARIAFSKCKKSNEKNRACAGYIAKQLLISDGMPVAQALDTSSEIDRLLDEWFQIRQTQPNFTPSDRSDAHISDYEIDLFNSPVES